MSVKQIELTDRWLGMWSRKVFPYAQQRETEGPVIVVDLESPAGAVLVGVRAAPCAGVDALRLSGQAGHQRARAPEAPADGRRIPPSCSSATIAASSNARRSSGISMRAGTRCRVARARRRGRRSISAAAASAPRTSASAAARSSARIRWGACRSRVPSICRRWARSPTTTAAGRTPSGRGSWEPWTGSYEWREAAVTRPAGTHHRWTLDQLVAVRDEERVRVGCVTRVAQDAHGELALSLRLWSATPRAIAVRPLSTAVAEDPPVPALLLAETPEDKASLILPPRTFNPGRVLRSLDSGPERRYRLTRLIHRGADFERVAFEETV